MSIRYTAEFGEDQWMRENVKLPNDGFYVDAGCAWPQTNSTSSFLRDMGWSGCCIDANPTYEPKWRGISPFTCCVIGDGLPASFEFHGVPELSRIGNGEIVQTKRLDALLQYSPHVDVLLIDVEGREFEALKTFDWVKNRPLVVCSEYSTYSGKPAELPQGCFYNEEKTAIEDFRVKEMLEAMGYTERHRTKANIIFTL